MRAAGADRDHGRARELAALRAGEALPPGDEAWLAAHLEVCAPCAAAASDYAGQHDLFEGLRTLSPEPPRDLWARTSAAIEAAGAGSARSRGRGPRRLLPGPLKGPGIALGSAVAVAVVLVAVGTGLLGTGAGTPGGSAAGATPIALTAVANVQVITSDSHGRIEIRTRPVDAVCPIGVAQCGAQPTFRVTEVSGMGSATTLQGAVSPTGGQMVVVVRSAGSERVYVIPVAPAPTPVSAGSSAPSPSVASPSAGSVAPSLGASASLPSGTAPPSVSPDLQSAPPGGAAATPSPDLSAAASGSPAAPPPATAGASDGAATGAPPPASGPTGASPSPAAGGAAVAAIQIASGVTVVGAPVYSPDGTRVAFSAMPSDRSAGPDVYVWAVGQATTAQAVTFDHDSWISGWTAGGILVSRVVSGMPATFLLDPATGDLGEAVADGAWLPTLSADGTHAVWWAGTVRRAADGVSWEPDTGNLVMGAWAAGGDATQALAAAPLGAWQARWADDDSVLALWAQADGKPGTERDGTGRLSLYRLDPGTLLADLADPMLAAAPANRDFSLRAGRLAWTAPSAAAPQVVEVLAWAGREIGRLEIPADGSGTVLP